MTELHYEGNIDDIILFKGWYIIIMPFQAILCVVILDILSIYSNFTYYKYKCLNMAIKSPHCTDVSDSSSRKAITL